MGNYSLYEFDIYVAAAYNRVNGDKGRIDKNIEND